MTRDNPKPDNHCLLFPIFRMPPFQPLSQPAHWVCQQDSTGVQQFYQEALVQSVVCPCQACGRKEAQTLIFFSSHQLLSTTPRSTRSVLRDFSSFSLPAGIGVGVPTCAHPCSAHLRSYKNTEDFGPSIPPPDLLGSIMPCRWQEGIVNRWFGFVWRVLVAGDGDAGVAPVKSC